MFSDITQMDSCKPPAVCASVHYDTARKAWVPLVKLIADGREISYPCCSKQRLCVMRGEESVEIDGEEVTGDEREELALKYPQFDEHYDRIKDLKEVIAGYTTSFFVCDESEGDESDEKDKSDDDEKSDDEKSNEKEKEKEKERRARTPPAAARAVRRPPREERSDDEKEKDEEKDDDKSEKSEKSDRDEKEEKEDEKERERKAATPTSKLRRLASRRGR